LIGRKPKFTLKSGDNPSEPEWTPSPVKVSLWNTRLQKALCSTTLSFLTKLKPSVSGCIVRVSPFPLCTSYSNTTSRNSRSLSLTSSPFNSPKSKNTRNKSEDTWSKFIDPGQVIPSLQATTAASIAIIRNSVNTSLEDSDVVGKMIAKARKESRFSYRGLGKIAGVNHTTIRNIEVGCASKPKANTLIRIARALNINPDDLMKAAGYITGGFW